MGFPLGAMSTRAKAYEAQAAVEMCIRDSYSEWRFSAKAGGAVLGSNTKFLYKMSIFFHEILYNLYK